MIEIFIFLFGLTVGSFLNCIIYRLQTGEGFLKGRSFCPHCKHQLSWQDLIPVFSFILLRARCRYCRQKISWRYPLVEISTAVIFLLILNFKFLIFNQFSIFPAPGGIPSQWDNFQSISILSQFITTLYLFIISSFLIVIFVYDLKHYIIPDKIIYPAIIIAICYQIISNFKFPISITNFQFLITNFYSPLLSAFGAATFFLTIVLVSRGKWMGVGDIKLAFLMGLILGWPNILVALFLSFLIGAIIGIGLIIFGRKTLKSEIPFGPFLVLGTFISLFWGQSIINWYLNTLIASF